ncbi:MAG: low molecular weight phosphotyrosine protein phosphatase [Flavobacterium sp.]|uniref:low molecular weight protein-tyrosine-phosphatase n=1 Tax=Flavobacterium sp. Leaf359 TaxID=1736351 RepID=UPI0006FF73BF|nr:low molecular weight protein-tyrosine-phosphatase [Flavobacterium sp. Leaf359]KQS47265.1 protein tyrosine phosphatase [Flavobacterium sp. Leaf359]MBU7570225.1 low molecular weight phosphotyrosine protein phosphatase [Flavobacterium sp.]PZO34762.1 MAG: low molecular weight phosphotyrosine protein phosphatase [Flavobacteriaceae bacterium]
MPVKILMVCLGNICRSPLAEGILQSKLPRDRFVVDSAGTGDWHIGRQPDSRSIAIAKSNGLDISRQRGRLFTATDFETNDYIFVMDNSNYKDVMRLAPNAEAKSKVSLILNELFPGENVDVPDPYFGLEDGFSNVYGMLDEVCEIIADKLKAKHQ